LVRFPFSDLSGSKLRPAVFLAYAGKEDWILCQITSNPFTDENAIQLDDDAFADGSLQRISYIRPGKLFTANTAIVARSIGRIKIENLDKHSQLIRSLLFSGRQCYCMQLLAGVSATEFSQKRQQIALFRIRNIQKMKPVF